jgi:anti-sigma regulatory factor (Ser/Thr protein kinase)
MADPGISAEPAGEPLLRRRFGASDLADLRHAVSHCLEAAGLSGDPLGDFVLAINELVTNAVRHGGGVGTLRLWHAGDRLVCEIRDDGSGIAAQTVAARDRPPPHTASGWGLWLARQLTSSMAVTTGDGGTLVRITAPLGTAA